MKNKKKTEYKKWNKKYESEKETGNITKKRKKKNEERKIKPLKKKEGKEKEIYEKKTT